MLNVTDVTNEHDEDDGDDYEDHNDYDCLYLDLDTEDAVSDAAKYMDRVALEGTQDTASITLPQSTTSKAGCMAFPYRLWKLGTKKVCDQVHNDIDVTDDRSETHSKDTPGYGIVARFKSH